MLNIVSVSVDERNINSARAPVITTMPLTCLLPEQIWQPLPAYIYYHSGPYGACDPVCAEQSPR